MCLPAVRVRSIVLVSLVFCGVSRGGAAETERIDFNRHIRPLIFDRCVNCHGPDEDKRAAGLRLDTFEGATEDLGGYAAIEPGDAEASEIVLRITSEDPDIRMPPPGKGAAFTAEELELVKRWIDEGGDYAPHWSYQAPTRPELPAVASTDWPINSIDYFALAKMEAAKKQPSPPADRLAIARRLALDLTGLPPTWDEAKTFADDRSPRAYENYVDRLLAKPAFGERWARVWLDLARYADSAGYADDPPRTIWAYRDYVIRSLNDNKPFDQFTIEQLAGDLLDDPSDEQLIATAFHRNTLTNNEGGTNDEEFRNEAVVDRVNTTFAVWMGTTMACAQCHTHKYDPITHEDYFSIFAFFNQSADNDRRDERPLLEIWTPKLDDQKVLAKAKVEGAAARLSDDLFEWFAATGAGGPDPMAPDGNDLLQYGDYLRGLSSEVSETRRELQQSRKALAKIRPLTTVPIMKELPPNKHRETHVQIRGNYRSTGAKVQARAPEVFHPLKAEDSQPDRLDLARWLVDPANPLTARVIVNRHWEQLFGIGIVETSEEFGNQGELPSHPQLLDWLAVEFVECGWDLKQLIKTIVMSATYRQSSVTTPADYQEDPANRLLTRGPRFRISAEMVRDQALAVSGLLSEKMHGPPVHPPQPNLGLKAAFGSKTDWKTSGGEDRYRRGLYTTWRRSSPYPSMAQFDAPNREVCTVRRIRTNTPLQALVTLNDPVYVEAAQSLARNLVRSIDADQDRITEAFRRVLTREPSEAESQRLIALLEQALENYAARTDEARTMACEPLGELPTGSDVVEHAAWTVVCNVILNLDEVFLKR
ncbi:MAG: PSD1 and planctomycete cytochrome C domain-containing protein [Planctomycetota bacterium]